VAEGGEEERTEGANEGVISALIAIAMHLMRRWRLRTLFFGASKVELQRCGADQVVRLWIADTDLDWFDFLAAQSNIDEVNFWQPRGGSNFGAIQPGELFVFRLKAPRNAIGGYGVFQHSSNLPISLAWEAFGVKNGASSLAEMRLRVGKYSDSVSSNFADYVIGCRIVVQPIFFPEPLWIPQPESWARSIVVGKTYSTEDREGLALWEHLMEFSGACNLPAGLSEPQVRYGEPMLIKPRLGQGAFRIAVTDAYHRTCAVSKGKVLPALDAAHIRPYALGETHELTNGILLRRDIHSIFDAGYVTIDEQYRFVVSDRVRTDFNNGEEYRQLHGTLLSMPEARFDVPDREAIRWHNEYVFRGS
jgi:putative restriction endonuclease